MSHIAVNTAIMKTTIDFPDQLIHRAKVIAAERRTTLRELMVSALEQVTESSSEEMLQGRKARIQSLLMQMKASNSEPMRPLRREELYDR